MKYRTSLIKRGRQARACERRMEDIEKYINEKNIPKLEIALRDARNTATKLRNTASGEFRDLLAMVATLENKAYNLKLIEWRKI